MSRWKGLSGVMAVVVALGLCVGLAMAQQQRGGGMGGGRFDPAQWRQRLAERMKEALGATDEEWSVIGPRLEKVQDLSRQARSGMGMGGRGGGRGMGRGGFGGGGGQPAAEEPQTEIGKAASSLQTVLQNEASTSAQIKESLTAYRKAREKVRQELAKAQEQLREVLTLRQEAQLVLMGTLD